MTKHPSVVAIEAQPAVGAGGSRVVRAARIASTAVALVTLGLAVNLVQLLLSPITLISRPLAHRLNSCVTWFSWTWCQYIFTLGNARLSFSGVQDLPAGESAYCVSNHVFFADWLFIHAVAQQKGMLPYCRYFLKDSIKYIPVFGWGMYLCRFPFLARNWSNDSRRINKTLGIFVNYKLPVWLCSFVEGHRFAPGKAEASRQYARNNNLPVLTYLLLPRCKGFNATVNALRGSHVKCVYDFTLAFYHRRRGFGAAPSLFEYLTGGLDDYQFHVHVDRIPITAVPEAEAESTQWLYARYVEKDRLLGDIRAAFERRLKRD